MQNEKLKLAKLRQLRHEAVVRARGEFLKAKGVEARHYARLRLQQRRRALEALNHAVD